MKRVVIIVITIAIVLGFKAYRKSEAGGKVKAMAMEQIENSLPASLDKNYAKSLVDYAHPLAMDAAYNMGGRHQSSSFDPDIYRSALRQHMTLKATQDGKSQYAQLFQ
jgi:hypothetical protein